MANPKRPRDPNQRAKLVVDIATGESDDAKAPGPKSPGRRRAGQAGGKARASALTSEERRAIAERAAAARWAKKAQA